MGELKFDMQTAQICAVTTGADTRIALKAVLDRITELEGYLCEAEVRSLLNFQRYEAAIGERHMVVDPALSWDDLGEDERELRIEIARKMLECEGTL